MNGAVSNASPMAVPSVERLADELDSLWIEYLAFLAQYDEAQKEIARLLSSGFFYLALANARAPVGRRYGQDWYDDRTKATTGARISQDTVESGNQEESRECSGIHSPRLEIVKGHITPSVVLNAPRQTEQPSPPHMPEGSSPTPSEIGSDLGDDASCEDTNPLDWFGILVPQELRKAQTFFSTAITGRPGFIPGSEDGCRTTREPSPVANAINAAEGMRRTEMEIRKARKVLKKAERSVANGNS